MTQEAIDISEAPVELGVGSRSWSGSITLGLMQLEENSHGEELSVAGSRLALLKMQEGRRALMTEYGLRAGGKSREGAPSLLPARLVLPAVWAERESGDLWPGWKRMSPGFTSALPKPPCVTLSESFRLRSLP